MKIETRRIDIIFAEINSDMKNIILTLIIAILTIGAKANGLEAYVSYGIYKLPEGKPYVETYLAVTGQSVKWKRENNKLLSNVEITLSLWKDTTIVSFSKEILKQQADSVAGAKTLNLVYEKRLQAPSNGKYTLKIKLHDLNDTLAPYYTGTIITIDFPADSTVISSIMPVMSFSKAEKTGSLTKSGYDLIPYIFDFYPTKITNFTFYAEIYPGGKLKTGDPFLLVYYLMNHESGKIIPKYKKYKRMQAATVNVALNTLDISNLPSGNFDFIMEIRDAKNQLLTTQYYFFQRENTDIQMSLSDIASVNITKSFAERITDKDTLELIIRSMFPISSELEKQFAESLISKGETYPMQQYILNFWEQRNPVNPEEPFRKYMEEVAKVEKTYSTLIDHGFETDRGRVYLQYGPPNTIAKNYNEPSAYPYEIWHYYKLANQSNRKFVFYNPTLSNNSFSLLHSDALGEPNDYQWRIHLRGRDAGYKSIDQTGEKETDWGSKYNEWYELPR